MWVRAESCGSPQGGSQVEQLVCRESSLFCEEGRSRFEGCWGEAEAAMGWDQDCEGRAAMHLEWGPTVRRQGMDSSMA